VAAVSRLEAHLVWLAIGLGTTLLVGWLRGALGGRRLERRAAKRFGRRAGLPVGDPPDPGLVRRVVRRQRFVLGGVAVGIVAGSSTDMQWLGGLYCGLAVGAVADRLTQPSAAPGTPRVAHATRIRVADYVPSWLVVAVAVAAAAVPTLAVMWVIAARAEGNLGDPLPSGTVAVLVLLALAALVASLWLARLIVGRRTTAGSRTELATDDALRAQAVRDALHLSAATSVLCVFTLSYSFLAVDGALRRIGGWLPLGVLVALAVVGSVHEVRGPRRWRARLHPELERAAAGSA
jgi:hypothetical protein